MKEARADAQAGKQIAEYRSTQEREGAPHRPARGGSDLHVDDHHEEECCVYQREPPISFEEPDSRDISDEP